MSVCKKYEFPLWSALICKKYIHKISKNNLRVDKLIPVIYEMKDFGHYV